MADRRMRDLLYPAFEKLGLISDYPIDVYDTEFWHVREYASGHAEAFAYCTTTVNSSGLITNIPWPWGNLLHDINKGEDSIVICSNAYGGSANGMLVNIPGGAAGGSTFYVYQRRLTGAVPSSGRYPFGVIARTYLGGGSA